ncbi:MAG: hypothetical protein PHH54_00230 [Candidatus Nanoarchaeia archaeon]|nr:hypothetical protein [Candidatus Nanoarchaeia archaeon]MDD5740389.1 hypothetical protein [Candidatus Nanoarchaeia archaeon]
MKKIEKYFDGKDPESQLYLDIESLLDFKLSKMGEVKKAVPYLHKEDSNLIISYNLEIDPDLFNLSVKLDNPYYSQKPFRKPVLWGNISGGIGILKNFVSKKTGVETSGMANHFRVYCSEAEDANRMLNVFNTYHTLACDPRIIEVIEDYVVKQNKIDDEISILKGNFSKLEKSCLKGMENIISREK